jgi:hypothetical protein
MYKVKRDPVTEALQFKLRNVVKGYMQEQGIDYDQSFAGVAGDTPFCLTLAISLYEEQKNDDWAVEAIDVDAAFLEGQMGHELYIDQPYIYQEYYVKPGIKLGENDVIRLKKSQYGCVQSARIWSKKFATIVTNNVCQLQQCKTDPCIFYRRDENGRIVLLMAAYIDDEILAEKR